MGYHSFTFIDTDNTVELRNIYSPTRDLANYYSRRSKAKDPFELSHQGVLLVPDRFGGGRFAEEKYEGYGVFQGQDAYVLLAEWNFPGAEKLTFEEKRFAGIMLFTLQSQTQEPLEYPLRIVSAFVGKNEKYEDFWKHSLNAPGQGHF